MSERTSKEELLEEELEEGEFDLLDAPITPPCCRPVDIEEEEDVTEMTSSSSFSELRCHRPLRRRFQAHH